MTHVRKLLLNSPELYYILVCIMYIVYRLYTYYTEGTGLIFSARVKNTLHYMYEYTIDFLTKVDKRYCFL